MKPSHAVVALGLVALTTGAVSLHAVSSGSSEPADVETGATGTTSAVGSEWVGVDGSIRRVLSAVGLAGRYPESHFEEIPDEVVRALASLDVPLVLPPGSGESS